MISLSAAFAALGRTCADALKHRPVWTVTYGVGRSCLALSTLLTLTLNSPDLLYRVGSGMSAPTVCSPLASHVDAFCLAYGRFGYAGLDAVRWLCIAGLVLVISGWRPRVTGVLHWVIATTFYWSSPLTDGGDQAATVLTLLMVPLTLTDPRQWHWQARGPVRSVGPAAVIAASTILAIRLQVAAIYLHASLGKVAVEEWTDGTSLYYWFNSGVVGLPREILGFAQPILTSWLIVPMSWSVIALEFCLAVGFLLPFRLRMALLAFGVLLHGGIAAFMGISSFSISMTAALVLYLPSVGDEAPWVCGAVERVARRLRRGSRRNFAPAHAQARP